MDSFEVVCAHCDAEISVRLAADSPSKPFTCPGCGRTIWLGAGQPYPQHDTSDSPAVQGTLLHFER